MFRRFTIFSITIACLIGLLYSFKFVKLPQFQLQQEISRLTGFPVWNGVLKNEDQQKSASATWLPIILIFSSTVASLAFTHKKSDYTSYFIFPDYPNSHDNNIPNITTKSFNKSLAYYTLFAFITGLTLYILESGKFWSSFSSLHHLLELIIILFLSLEGQIHKNKFIMFFVCSTYIILVNLLTILLKWPLDSIWFKSQGLILDFALVIIFLRIYFHTHYYIRGQKSLLLPTNNNNNIQPEGQEIVTNEKSKVIKHPNQVILLPLAAFVHLFGSVTNTLLFNNIIGNMAFSLSNAIAFPMYSFYIYLDTHYTIDNFNSKNIVLPYTPTWKLILIFLWSIILSVLTIRCTVFFK